MRKRIAGYVITMLPNKWGHSSRKDEKVDSPRLAKKNLLRIIAGITRHLIAARSDTPFFTMVT